MPAYPMTEEPIELPTGGVRTLIRDLGGDENPGHPPYPYTGVIRLTRGDKQAAIWVHGGVMYSTHLDGYNPPVALRLKSARFLNDEQFAQLQSLPSGDAGPEAVDRNWVPAYIVEELHREIMLSTLSHLYDWNDAQWWWEEDETTDLYVTSGLPLMLASAAVDERIGQWKAVTRAYPHVVQPKAVPHPGPSWNRRDITIITPEMETMLSCINGQSSVSQIASQCGLTRFEIAKILSQTVAVGIVTFTAGVAIANAPAPMPTQKHGEPQAFPTAPDASALAAAPPPMAGASRPAPESFPVPQSNADALLSAPISYSSPDEELISGDHPTARLDAEAPHDEDPGDGEENIATEPELEPEDEPEDEAEAEPEVTDETEADDEDADKGNTEGDTDADKDSQPEDEPDSDDDEAAQEERVNFVTPEVYAELKELKEKLDGILAQVEGILEQLNTDENQPPLEFSE